MKKAAALTLLMVLAFFFAQTARAETYELKISLYSTSADFSAALVSVGFEAENDPAGTVFVEVTDPDGDEEWTAAYDYVRPSYVDPPTEWISHVPEFIGDFTADQANWGTDIELVYHRHLYTTD